MKKVLLIGYNLDMGGAEKALINIINLIKDKCDIDLLLLEKKGILLNEVNSNVNIIEVKKNIIKYFFFRFFPYFRKKIVNKLVASNYDLGIAFMEGRAATILTDIKCDCKKIAWIHNDVNDSTIGISDKEVINSYSKIDEIIAVSNQSKKSFCSKYSIPTKKVKVIYNIIDEKNVIKKSKVLNPVKSKFTFIIVAKMRSQKRYDRLMDAIKLLKDDKLDFELWIIGTGPLEKQIKEQAIKLKINDYIKFMGLMDNPFPYVRVADYFVLPSDHEGYPLSLLESLLLKTPVISTNVPGAKEILGNNKYGYIVNKNSISLYKKMKEIIQNNNDDIKNNLLLYKSNKFEIEQKILSLFEL